MLQSPKSIKQSLSDGGDTKTSKAEYPKVEGQKKDFEEAKGGWVRGWDEKAVLEDTFGLS